MKIVDICEFYSPRGGGVRTYVDQKLAAAASLGADWVILAPGPRDATETRAGGRIHWVRSPPTRLDARYHRFNDAAAVHALLDSEAPDVIEISSPWMAAKIGLGYDRPSLRSFIFHMDPVAVYPETFLSPHLSDSLIDRLSAPLWAHLRRINAACDLTLVASKTVAARLAQRGFSKLAQIPLGVELPLFARAKPEPALRAQMLRACGFDAPGTPLLIAVSRHHPEKRLGLLMQAVTAINARQPLALYIVGHGPWAWRVQAQARRAKGVHAAGVVDNRAALAAMLASADALLHGGAAETYGIAVAEALATGLPVIVPDRGGAADFAGGAAAISYRAGDVDACTAAILTLLADKDLRFRRAAAKGAAHGLLSPRAHVQQLLACYAQLTPFTPGLAKNHNLATMPPRC
jgi:alpha-1,6-mannosyltransferase